MDKEILQESINYLLSIPGYFLLFLFAWNFSRTLCDLKWKWRKFGLKHLFQIGSVMKTPLFGLLVILSSFALTNTLLDGVPSVGESKWLELEAENPETILEGVLYIGNTGMIGTGLFILAGFFYILSGFGEWMKWIARFFMLAAPAYILMQIFHFAVLAA